MRIEYKIRVSPMNAEGFDKLVRGLPYFGSFDKDSNTYTLLDPHFPKKEGIAFAFVSLLDDGLYFCDVLTETEIASHIFRGLIDEALSSGASVAVEQV